MTDNCDPDFYNSVDLSLHINYTDTNVVIDCS